MCYCWLRKSYLCAVARRPSRHVEVPVHDGLADVLVADLPGQNVSVVELLFSHRVSEKLRALIGHQLDSLSIRFWRGTGLATSTFYIGWLITPQSMFFYQKSKRDKTE